MSIGFKILNLDYSPVKGPEGNIEYLLYLQNNGEEPVVDEICVDHVCQLIRTLHFLMF